MPTRAETGFARLNETWSCCGRAVSLYTRSGCISRTPVEETLWIWPPGEAQ